MRGDLEALAAVDEVVDAEEAVAVAEAAHHDLGQLVRGRREDHLAQPGHVGDGEVGALVAEEHLEMQRRGFYSFLYFFANFFLMAWHNVKPSLVRFSRISPFPSPKINSKQASSKFP